KSSSKTARFAWKTVGKVHRSVCKLDDGKFKACSSPRKYTGLAAGPHQFQLVVKSTSGSLTLQRGWVVTAAAASTPTVSFTAQPAATTTSTDATFKWQAS